MNGRQLLQVEQGVAVQWHPTKNGTLTPRDVTAFDNEKRWWLCEKGHDWDATVSNRSNGKDCPYCSGHKVIKGETDLATRFPVIALDWHLEKNKGVLPSDISPFANIKYWWCCKKGHDWEATPSSRCNGSGCPYCAKQKAILGETDFATLFPLLAPEWHPEKNGGVKPCDITAFSAKKYWWSCKHGHDWEASPASRSKGVDCPFCAGRKPILGETDFTTRFPLLALEWHPEKNGDIKPCDIIDSTTIKYWWICKYGHEWDASPYSRSRGSGCPKCKGRKKMRGKYL